MNKITHCPYCGGSLLSKIVKNSLNAFRLLSCPPSTRSLYDGEYHYGCHNFTGPGTRIDLPDVQAAKPYNHIDDCSRIHDLDYMFAALEKDEKKRSKLIRDADLKVIDCYDHFMNENGHDIAKFFIKHKITAEKISPKIVSYLLGKERTGGKLNFKYMKNFVYSYDNPLARRLSSKKFLSK